MNIGFLVKNCIIILYRQLGMSRIRKLDEKTKILRIYENSLRIHGKSLRIYKKIVRIYKKTLRLSTGRLPGGSWEKSITYSQLKIWRSCTPTYDLMLTSDFGVFSSNLRILDMPSCLYMQFFERNPHFKSKLSKSNAQRPKNWKNEPNKFI